MDHILDGLTNPDTQQQPHKFGTVTKFLIVYMHTCNHALFLHTCTHTHTCTTYMHTTTHTHTQSLWQLRTYAAKHSDYCALLGKHIPLVLYKWLYQVINVSMYQAHKVCTKQYGCYYYDICKNIQH